MPEKRVYSPRVVLPIALALVLYLGWCWTLGVGTAGLQQDEAISFRGAARLVFHDAERPCPHGESISALGQCWPVMLAPYVGTPKDYFLLPAFLVGGVNVGIARMGAGILAAVSIAGLWFFLLETRGAAVAATAALGLAIHPSFIDLPLFDNGNIAFSIAVLGLLLMVSALLMKRVTYGRVFALGLLAGLGVWSRLNFSWLLISALAGILFVSWREARRALPYLPAFCLGGVIGAAPLLMYLSHNLAELMTFMNAASVNTGFADRLSSFSLVMRDVLLADREHRVIWGGDWIPAWESRTAAIVVMLCVGWCLLMIRTRPVRALSVSALVLTLFYASSKLPVAEHHAVIFVPLAVMFVAICCCDVMNRFGLAGMRWMRIPFAALALLYGLTSIHSNLEAAQGMHKTGGTVEWASTVNDLVKVLEKQNSGPLYELDWGFQQVLYTLSRGRLSGSELFFNANAQETSDGRRWVDVVNGGGVFVTYGTRYLRLPQSTLIFRRVLNCLKSRYETLPVRNRDGSEYAVVYTVFPFTGSLDQTARACLDGPRTEFFADPNPIIVRDGSGVGETALFINTAASRAVEVHVQSPDGPLFARIISIMNETTAVAPTEKWVADGTTFYIQDVSNGKKLSAENTLGTVKVRVVKSK